MQRTRHRIQNESYAFTLVELIVVLGIISLIFGMSVPFFAKFGKGSKLRNASASISTVLRTARSYAITKRKNYLVIINDQMVDDVYQAVKIYQVDEGTIDKWYQLPRGIEINEIKGFDEDYALVSVPFPHDADTPQQKPAVEFKPTGGAKYNGSIYIKDNEGGYKRIKVYNVTGRIKVTDEAP